MTAALREGARRQRLPFRSVNRPGLPGHQPGMQRHHLLPRGLLAHRAFLGFLDSIGRDRLDFDDFRTNGLLLPAAEQAALRLGLPLHRGPHRQYNELVAERVGQIEAGWARARGRSRAGADQQALMRFDLLQRALRRRLLDPHRSRVRLNASDPLGRGLDFTELDAMAASLWADTEN